MIDDARSLDEAIGRLAGAGVQVTGRSSVSGGCIANGARLDLSDGKRLGQLVRDWRRQAAEAGWHPEKWDGCAGERIVAHILP